MIDLSGVGVYELSASETYNSVKWALQVRILSKEEATLADQRAVQAGYRLVCRNKTHLWLAPTKPAVMLAGRHS